MFCSIITVTRNNASGLEKTIRSILSQRRDLFEFILIDGNSTDNTHEIISRYQHECAYQVSEPDKGIYDAMNKGLQHVKGDYVIFMNSGDEFAGPDVLEKVWNFQEKADIMIGGVHSLREGKIVGEVFPDFTITAYNLFYRTVCHQATFVRWEIFAQVGGFDLKYKVVADWIIVFQALVQYHHSYSLLPFCIADYDVTGISSGKAGAQVIRKEKDAFMHASHPLLYLDFCRMHRFLRFTPSNIVRYLKWRLLK